MVLNILPPLVGEKWSIFSNPCFLKKVPVLFNNRGDFIADRAKGGKHTGLFKPPVLSRLESNVSLWLNQALLRDRLTRRLGYPLARSLPFRISASWK